MQIIKKIFLCVLTFGLTSLYSCKSCKDKKDGSVEDSINKAVNKIEEGMHEMGQKVGEGMDKIGEGAAKLGEGLKNRLSDFEKWKGEISTYFANKDAKKIAEKYCDLSSELTKKTKISLSSARDAVEEAKVEQEIEKLKSKISDLDKELEELYKKLPEEEVNRLKDFIGQLNNAIN